MTVMRIFEAVDPSFNSCAGERREILRVDTVPWNVLEWVSRISVCFELISSHC